MKTPIVKKSTFKGILIWVAAFCLFSLAVFMTKAVDLSEFKIIIPARELTQAKWNSLIWWIESLFDDYETKIKKMEIPNGTVIIYAWAGGCPTWWKQWWDWLDWRFLMPLQTSDGTSVKYWGSKTFKIKKENLPKHSHKIISIGQGSAWIAPNTYLAAKNFGTSNIGYADYHLQWASGEPTLGLTSEEWWTSKEIRFTPEYVKILFCVKGNADYTYQGGSDDGDDEGNNVGGNCEEVAIPKCWSKHKWTWEPTTSAEKCIESSPSGVTSNNGIYSWTCTTWGNSIDCYSFPSVNIETKVDGECDYSHVWWCSAWTLTHLQSINIPNWNVRVWGCSWIWEWSKSVSCRLGWECWSAWSCVAISNTYCADKYLQAPYFGQQECQAAWAYWVGNNTWGSPCTINKVPDWAYHDYFANAPICSSNYVSCLEWKTASSLSCMIGDSPAAQTDPSSCSELERPTSCGAVSLNYCWSTKGKCINWASLKANSLQWPPEDQQNLWWVLWNWQCVDGDWISHQCQWCIDWCVRKGDSCYKPDAAGNATQTKC